MSSVLLPQGIGEAEPAAILAYDLLYRPEALNEEFQVRIHRIRSEQVPVL